MNSVQALQTYTPGLHVICDFTTRNVATALSAELFQQKINALLQLHELQKLGEVYHQFENAGFTAVVCLTDSHISVHTWPEFEKVTFDVFLSNYRGLNNTKAQLISDELLQYFDAEQISRTELKR